MTTRAMTGLAIGILALAASATVASALGTTNLLTVYGLAWATDDVRGAAPVGYTVTVWKDSQGAIDSLVCTVTEAGKYEVTFINFQGGLAASEGDSVQVTLRDPDGVLVGDVAHTTVQADAIAAHLLAIEVNKVPNATEPTTWGGIKALYR